MNTIRIKSNIENNNIKLEINAIPKLLALILNNEKKTNGNLSKEINSLYLTNEELKLYNKWLDKFKEMHKYNDCKLTNEEITNYATRDAKYVLSVFTPIDMTYVTSKDKLEHIVGSLIKYINNNKENKFYTSLRNSINSFIIEIAKNNILNINSIKINKDSCISLFQDKISSIKPNYGDNYTTRYRGSYLLLEDSLNYHNLDYAIEFDDNTPVLYIPSIIENYLGKDKHKIESEWILDLQDRHPNLHPQAENILILEKGNYKDFLLKYKDVLSSKKDTEIYYNVIDTIKRYPDKLSNSFITKK